MYPYARHLCSTDGGVHLTLVSECAVFYIYRSAIPLHVAVKTNLLYSMSFDYIYRHAIALHVAVNLLLFTIALLILLSKGIIIIDYM